MNKKIRRLLVAWFLVNTISGFSISAPSTSTKGTSFEGEIVDVGCYVGLQQKENHQGKCTKSCLLDGTPVGLATPDGTLYLLLENSTDRKPYQLAKQTSSQKVRIFGRTYTRGGMQVLTVDRLEMLGQEAAGCADSVPDSGSIGPGYCGEN